MLGAKGMCELLKRLFRSALNLTRLLRPRFRAAVEPQASNISKGSTSGTKVIKLELLRSASAAAAAARSAAAAERDAVGLFCLLLLTVALAESS